ncbi:ester cyclase [Actinocorallia sp. API 0066]|uniref:ester cyclase n=1 Tax=Actinocorallia sp. API 0066 TaxID=2896846 RepID=UPI001E513D34|nr:ester cyclase [Actinocorallia sp. API 0066]MCD0449834.1 ester cyclase [Actinocorallia sp. API 0066]
MSTQAKHDGTDAEAVLATAERNKELTRRFYAELVTGPNPDLLEEFVAPDAVDETTAGVNGIEDFRGHLAWIAGSAGKVTATVTDAVADGDRVVAFWRIEGTHTGELFGLPPTGKPFSGYSVSTLTFRDGKIVRYAVLPDRLGILQQLGGLG